MDNEISGSEMDMLLSVVMPCLNEEKTIGICIKKAREAIKNMGIKGEVVVADNGSTDNSVNIAVSLGARVVHQDKKGYGMALIKGIKESKGRYVIIGDSDDSYDFSRIEDFLKKLTEGNDVVMGSRLRGSIEPGAMSLSHRIGNPVMTWLLNLLFNTGVSDINCGMRAFSKDAFQKMELKHAGMEFASEFVIRASKERLRMSEVPIHYYRAGRNRPPHLRTFKDGWRHLRFMLIYSPSLAYLFPGVIIFTLGFLILGRGLYAPFRLGPVVIDYHFNFLGSLAVIIGFQLCTTGLFARSFAYIRGFDKYDIFIERFIRNFSLERGAILSIALMGLSMLFFGIILFKWLASGFGPLAETRNAITAVTLFILGFQYLTFSFFISMLLMDYDKKDD